MWICIQNVVCAVVVSVRVGAKALDVRPLSRIPHVYVLVYTTYVCACVHAFRVCGCAFLTNSLCLYAIVLCIVQVFVSLAHSIACVANT